MSSINNALLPTYSLRAQPHAVLVASVADGAEEIERLKRENSDQEEELKQFDIWRKEWATERNELQLKLVAAKPLYSRRQLESKLADAKAALVAAKPSIERLAVEEARRAQSAAGKMNPREVQRNLLKQVVAAIDAAREATK